MSRWNKTKIFTSPVIDAIIKVCQPDVTCKTYNHWWLTFDCLLLLFIAFLSNIWPYESFLIGKLTLLLCQLSFSEKLASHWSNRYISEKNNYYSLEGQLHMKVYLVITQMHRKRYTYKKEWVAHIMNTIFITKLQPELVKKVDYRKWEFNYQISPKSIV